MIDFILLAILALVIWTTANDGVWGAAITFVCVLISGLLAMNFFEPLAGALSANFLNSFEWQNRWDVIALLGIFAGCVFALRALAEKLLPTYAEVHPGLYQIGRWVFGALTGYTVVSILLTAVHVAPVPREFLGFTPERHNFFGMSPDRQWLGFTQYVSEHGLGRRDLYGNPRIFDGARYPRTPGGSRGIDHTTPVWSSFPIKYAARRHQYATGSSGGASTPAPPPMSGGARGGSAGF